MTASHRVRRKSKAKPAPRKPKAKPRPKPKVAWQVVEQARLAISEGCRMTDDNANASLVLFALGRALHREHAALGTLVAAAREGLDRMGESGQAGDDDLTHRRLVVVAMSKMLLHQRDALAGTDPRRPPPLPAAYLAQALSRMLASGPLRHLYTSLSTPEGDRDAERVLAAWADCVGADGRVRIDGEPAALARKLVVRALVALGVAREAALDGLVRKGAGTKASKRLGR